MGGSEPVGRRTGVRTEAGWLRGNTAGHIEGEEGHLVAGTEADCWSVWGEVGCGRTQVRGLWFGWEGGRRGWSDG